MDTVLGATILHIGCGSICSGPAARCWKLGIRRSPAALLRQKLDIPTLLSRAAETERLKTPRPESFQGVFEVSDTIAVFVIWVRESK